MSGRSPFDEVELLVIDGNNLLHRTAGGLGPAAARVLIPRLRAVLPTGVSASIILDGMPDPGAPIRERIGSVTILHAGRRSADDAIVEAVERRSHGERPRTIVVTDDRALADRIRRLGALHRRVDWLQGKLDLTHRGPRTTRAAQETDDDDERIPWSPGRGATKKRGNPRRARPPR